jgi:subtilisin family serine protease
MRRPAAVAAALALVALAAAGPAGAVGTDPGLSQQWGLRQIGAPAAWSTSVGAGVPIAIVDTGVDLGHEDLRGQIGAAVTCVGTGGDPAKCVADGQDVDGHGSHVAGIAAAAANDVGVSGVAPGARLIAVRVFSKTKDAFGRESLGASTDDINAGIRWVIRNVGGKGVINLSIGDDLPVALGSAGFSDGVEEAWAAGWVTALAAGNEGNLLGLNGEEYGDLDAVVVGATGPDGSVSSYSSPIGSAKWGVVAPGGDASDCRTEQAKCVLSTYLGGQYAFLEGTSMATPHVAGGLALLMATGLSNAGAVQRLLATLDSSKTCGSGCTGRLDVAKAVSGLAPAGGGAGATTTAAPSGGGTTGASGSGGTVRPTATTTARRPSAGGTTTPTAAPPASDPTTTAAPDTSVPEETTSTTSSDVETLSIDEAAGEATSSAGDGDDRSVPLGLVAFGLLALAAVAVPTAREGVRARGGGGR